MKKKNADSLSIQYHQLIELAKAIDTESFSGELQSKNQCPARFLPYIKSLKNSGFDSSDIFERITPIEKTKKERNKDIPGIQYYPIDFMIKIERKQYLSKDTKKRNPETKQWRLSIGKLLNSVKENIEMLRKKIESTVAEIDTEYKASQPPPTQDNPSLSPEDSIRKILENFIVLAYGAKTYPPPATWAKPNLSQGICALNKKMIMFGFGELLKPKDFCMTQEMYDNIAHGYPLDKFSSLLQRRIDIHVNALRSTGWTFPPGWPDCLSWKSVDDAERALSQLSGYQTTSAPIVAASPELVANNAAAAPTSKTKTKNANRRIKGHVWYEVTADGTLKKAGIAVDRVGEANEITFPNTKTGQAAERLFIVAASAGGSFTRADVKAIGDDMHPPLSDATLDDVRDALDYAICSADGKTGRGWNKPKAFTLENGKYISDLEFKCLTEDAEKQENNRMASQSLRHEIMGEND